MDHSLVIENLELPGRGSKPLSRITIQDDGQPPFSIRVKLLDEIQAPLEVPKKHLRHTALVLDGLTKVMDRLAILCGVSALLQIGKPLRHHYVVADRLMRRVGLHLRMNKRAAYLVVEQGISYIV